MPKQLPITFDGEICKVQIDMKEDGTHGDAAMHYDVADALLSYEPFKVLAQERFRGKAIRN